MMKYKILLVDDDIGVINSINRIVDNYKYELMSTNKPEKALELLKNNNIDILLCDQRMPNVSGLEVIEFAKNTSPATVRMLITGYADIKIIISAINDGKIFCYIEKPWSQKDLLDKIEEAISWKNEQEIKEAFQNSLLINTYEWVKLVEDLKQKLDKNKRKIILMLLKMIKERDKELYIHSLNTTKYALMLADLIGLSDGQKQDLKSASLIHDIGKITIRDRILYKPGSLNSDEYKDIKKHSDIGADIIEQIGYNGKVATIIRQHHEHIDGTGYPLGITGDQILIEAKILSVADVFDALTSDRIYRKAMNYEDALSIMKSDIGTHFDSHLLEAFSRRVTSEKKYSVC